MTRLSKLIFLLVLLPALLCFARGDYYKGVGGAVVITPCTDASLGCQSADTSTWGLTTETYQAFKAQGAAITICQVDVTLYNGTEGNVHIEVWDTATTQYGDDSDAVTVTDGSYPGTSYTFTWSGTEPTVPISTDFRVFLYEDSGAIRVHTFDNDANCYEDTDYDFCDPTDRNMDAFMKLYGR